MQKRYADGRHRVSVAFRNFLTIYDNDDNGYYNDLIATNYSPSGFDAIQGCPTKTNNGMDVETSDILRCY